MKRITLFLISFLASLVWVQAQEAERQCFGNWEANKYSMFIHFGLYSHLGGVWEGEPVRRGYSEQIQSFAGIFSDWYAGTACEFEPVNFDADSIAVLARNAGMRSIVFTSKHHDGFCMYDTETTSYNSTDMLREGRDFVKELSEACGRHGLNFGLYFSLIDWNFPHAYPISSHNADFITKEHHEFNKSQVRELLTGYGRISELWFDMGSLEPWQSQELYDLVKSLQPDCMVSGRLGNDVYDFAVMADNKLPQTALHAPWQSAASMFPETWSYRSWQERGNVADKVAEKLRSLVKVVSHGGNYLLNIGPASDGSIVPFEREVLLQMGKWLETNGKVLYETDASPFAEDFSWGDVTVKGNLMHLILTGTCPGTSYIELPVKGMTLIGSEGARAEMKRDKCVVEVGPEMYSDGTDIKVVTLEFDRSFDRLSSVRPHPQNSWLSWAEAVPHYSYSCFDYYSNYRSTVAYGWDVDIRKPVDEIEVLYTPDEEGREVILEIDDIRMKVLLSSEKLVGTSAEVSMRECRYTGLRGGVFDGPSSWDGVDISSMPVSASMVESPVRPFSNCLMAFGLHASKPGLHMFDVTAGNGVEVVVNGRVQTKHLNPYRTVKKTEKILINLPAGDNQVLVRFYNRFEDRLSCGMEPSAAQDMHYVKVQLPRRLERGRRHVNIYAADKGSVHADCMLHNLRIRL